MERTTLAVEKRDKIGKGGARSLRRDGFIPAVMYRGGESSSVMLNGKELAQFVSKTAGEQVIVNLKFPEETKQAIVKDYQMDPVTGTVLHADFQEILATEVIKVMVHIALSGEPVGVKRDGGILQYGIRDIEIECLPDKIPGHIALNVAGLELNHSIHVSDLKLGEGIKVLTDPDEMIVTVTALKEEVAAPAAEETAAAAAETVEPEVIKKGKKTEEESK